MHAETYTHLGTGTPASKYRTRMHRGDQNQDGHIPREDLELMAKRFVEFLNIADDIDLKPRYLA
jgi:hypothetical protein